MYYPCSENKGADQLRGYREADLRLCFRLGKNPVFSRCGSYENETEVITKVRDLAREPKADRVQGGLQFKCRVSNFRIDRYRHSVINSLDNKTVVAL